MQLVFDESARVRLWCCSLRPNNGYNLFFFLFFFFGLIFYRYDYLLVSCYHSFLYWPMKKEKVNPIKGEL